MDCLFADRYELTGGAREARLVTELPVRDVRTRTARVLWLPHEALVDSDGARARFLAGARAAGPLPGLLPILDAADAERLYVAVPPAKRPAFSLATLLERRGGVSGIALRLARILARTLDGAHAAGLVHGFLGVQDLWLLDGRLLLSGVGMWHALDRAGTIDALGLATLAPEVRAGAGPTARSDIYGLAALCARLLGGGAGGGITVATATDARVMLALAPALSRIPSARPPTCAAVVAALELALHHRPSLRPAGVTALAARRA